MSDAQVADFAEVSIDFVKKSTPETEKVIPTNTTIIYSKMAPAIGEIAGLLLLRRKKSAFTSWRYRKIILLAWHSTVGISNLREHIESICSLMSYTSLKHRRIEKLSRHLRKEWLDVKIWRRRW